MDAQYIEQSFTDLHQKINNLAEQFRRHYKQSQKDFIEAVEDKIGKEETKDSEDLLFTLEDNMQILSEYIDDEIDTFNFTGKKFAAETANNINKMLQKVTSPLSELINLLEDHDFEGTGKLTLQYFDELMADFEAMEDLLYNIMAEY